MRSSVTAALLTAAAVLDLTACGAKTPAVHPAALRGAPGSLLGFTQVAAPSGSFAWRIRYVSTGLDGRPIEVTGVVVAPRTHTANRPVLAYAHGTFGIAEKCAPSTMEPSLRYISGLHEMIARGMVVAATDYPGLGSPGPHPYLIGVSEGRAVLDSVRAARAIAAAHASARFVPWGYSQGGHAALFAGQLAASYAPELKQLGIAAGAPPTNLSDTIAFHIDQNRNRLLAAYLISAWSDLYHLPLGEILSDRSIRVLRPATSSCLGYGTIDKLTALFHNFNLGSSFFNERMRHNAAWNVRFKENSPQSVRGQPYFIAQGLNDTVVPVNDTTAYVKRACASGDRVKYLRLPGEGHVEGDAASANAAVAWIADRFKGVSPPNQCAAVH